MKKLLLSLAAITTFGAANAQKMGDVFVNGSIGYSHFNSEFNNGSKSVSGPIVNHFSFVPSIGYQFSKNWGVGIGVEYDYNRGRFAPGGLIPDTTLTNHSFRVGPFLRYTKHLSPLFFVNAQLNAMYVTNRGNLEIANTATTTNSMNGVDVNLMPSVGINITRTLALTGAIGRLEFATMRDEDPSNNNIYTRTNAFEATFGREFMLGVQWNFGTGATPGRRHRHRMEPMSETRRMDRYRDNDGDNDNDNATEEAPRRRRRSRD